MKHPYWGIVEMDWLGCSSQVSFSHPFFEEENIKVFLGDTHDENWEEIDELPTMEDLNAYQENYMNFIANIEQHISTIQARAFDRYLKVYARHCENPEKSGEPPLGIDTIEKHNANIKDVSYLRLSSKNEIRISIRYAIDTEHGLEFLFIDGELKDVGGIAET